MIPFKKSCLVSDKSDFEFMNELKNVSMHNIVVDDISKESINDETQNFQFGMSLYDNSEYSDPPMQDNLSDNEDSVDDRNYQTFADECKRFDPNYVPQYAEKIILNIQKTEKNFRIPITNFKKIQTEINLQVRDQLVKWVISLHHNLGISSNALHNAIYYFDLVLSTINIPNDKIRLYASVCLSIAAKVESLNSRFVKRILEEYTEGFTKEDYDECEVNIIRLLKYELQFPNSYVFLKRLFTALQSPPNLMFLCLLVCEASLLSFQIHRFDPSLIAVSIYILCSSYLNMTIPFSTLKYYSHVQNLQKVEKCVPILIHCANEVLQSDASATYQFFVKSTPTNSLHEISFEPSLIERIKELDLSMQ